MILFALSFLLGDLYLQYLAYLPSLHFVILIVPTFIFWVLFKKYFRFYYLLFAFVLGFSWATWYSHTRVSWSLPPNLEGKPIVVTGYIASLPISVQQVVSFEFELPHHHFVRLIWRDCRYALRVGDKWQLTVRLKRIHSTQNPGEFDFEAWAIQQGLRATGYVVSSESNTFLLHEKWRYMINQLRQTLFQKIQSQLPATHSSSWLMTLMLGEHMHSSQAYWEVLRATGTNHLMAIAGLHIGLLAGYMRYCIASVWRYFPYLVLRLPATSAGTIAALISACIYSAFAGFSLPTQRACLMLGIISIGILRKQKMNAWHAWGLALLIVLLLNPLSVLTESFWLSFFTIALIIYGMSGRLRPQGKWWKWGRVQWVIGFGLTPLSLALFQQASFISFFANCIAIPWMGLFILPFCFLSSIFIFIFPHVAGWSLYVADKSLSCLWLFLSWLAHWPISAWHQTIPSTLSLVISMVGVLLMLLPAGIPGRWLGMICLMPLIFYKPSRPAAGDIWLTILDVGQGLAVVVQTHDHTLLYDTGLRTAYSDMGESVILPYLYSAGIRKIDMLVISHGDLDHSGGAQAILKQLPVKTIFTSVPDALPAFLPHYCLFGHTWQWDDVKFTFLYPTPEKLHLKNDSSCVLKIENGEQAILLTGDIEKLAEKELVTHIPKQLSATILVVPHHGSKTSGLRSFVSLVHPQWAIYATGYRNRYHFPHSSIVKTYQQLQAIQLNTVDTGAIQFKLRKAHPVYANLYRIVNKHYWFA